MWAMNEEQATYWNGPAGDRWAQQQAVLDRALAAYGRAVLERAAAKPGEHVLDIGCGCGETSLALSERVGANGSVLGIDLSTPMLTRARERGRDRANLTFLQGDASSMAFPRKFDLLFSRFGVMFFEDPIAAFRHLHAAAQSGGRLAFVCWRPFEENRWAALPVHAVRSVVPEVEPPNQDAPGPYAFADSAKVERILTSAGFRNVGLDRFDADVVLAGDDLEQATQFAVNAGPAARILASLSPDLQSRARDAVRSALESARTPKGFALPGTGWLVTARV
jgi:ubiquinone/menaquinone biosynthesis C-methylase UbiE